MAKEIKLSFREFAEFIYSDHTVDMFPDIGYPPETRFKAPRIAWLTDSMAKRYEEFLANPNGDEDTDTVEVDNDEDN